MKNFIITFCVLIIYSCTSESIQNESFADLGIDEDKTLSLRSGSDEFCETISQNEYIQGARVLTRTYSTKYSIEEACEDITSWAHARCDLWENGNFCSWAQYKACTVNSCSCAYIAIQNPDAELYQNFTSELSLSSKPKSEHDWIKCEITLCHVCGNQF